MNWRKKEQLCFTGLWSLQYKGRATHSVFKSKENPNEAIAQRPPLYLSKLFEGGDYWSLKNWRLHTGSFRKKLCLLLIALKQKWIWIEASSGHVSWDLRLKEKVLAIISNYFSCLPLLVDKKGKKILSPLLSSPSRFRRLYSTYSLAAFVASLALPLACGTK